MQYMSMTLDEYLTSKEITDADFAKRIERDPGTVSRLRRGLTKPDWQTLPRILDATNGEVTPNDFLPSDTPARTSTEAA